MKLTLEDAQVVVGQAAACLDRHDGIMASLTENRSNFEMAMVRPDGTFDQTAMVDKFVTARQVLRKYGERIVERTPHDTVEEFRRCLTVAKHQMGILAEYQEAIDRKAFYLDIYENSGYPPDIDVLKGEEFDLEKEKLKLANLVAQYEYALGQFLDFAATLDIGEPSKLIPTPGLTSPGGSRI